MDKTTLQPHFLKSQLVHAFGPGDLTRMQVAFDHLCADEAVAPVSENQRNNLAKAIVAVYNSEMNEATLITAVLASYGGPRSPQPDGAESEQPRAASRLLTN